MSTTSENVQLAFGFISMDELHYLQALARGITRNNPVVLNIGAGPGTSGVGFAESRKDLILHTCDISDLSNPNGCLEAERDQMKVAGLYGKFGRTWFQHHMSSVKLAEVWDKRTNSAVIDLLFIDGDHTEKGCSADILGFFPHVRDGGLIVVHDYDKPSTPKYKIIGKDIPGVTLAVNKILPGIATYYGRVTSTVAYKKPLA